ncbi:AAA family ATPase [Gemmata sp. JC717]|uniref:AAA family ATPase n=1 Tax=Gemmata algarum TaxID=2975278 RepID=UPI0021BB5EC7|nr:AAA family ATPase [Gemmata algarum]MDY3551036.1 AAA family ATPase [Gemmata algarum]
MKLAKIRIENFRHLGTGGKPFELDFTDPLGRVRDFTLLVGPNTSGKTTVLDAIAAALGPSLDLFTVRPDFRLSPREIVTRGATQTTVTCWLRFTDDEVKSAKEIYRQAALPSSSQKVPTVSEVKLAWTYPDPESKADSGLTSWDTDGVLLLLRARTRLARLLPTGRADWSWFQKVGGVFTFGQERTWVGRTVSRQVWNIIHGIAGAAVRNRELRAADPESILLNLAVQSLVPLAQAEGHTTDQFSSIRDKYAQICFPRRIVGAVRDELNQLTIQFADGEREYGYAGLSSGEKMLLLLLIRFVSEHIHRSIVLIDELELNQHPLWQRRLLHMIPRMGDNNQIIATTHSPYLRDAVPPDAVIELGGLGDDSRAEGA